MGFGPFSRRKNASSPKQGKIKPVKGMIREIDDHEGKKLQKARAVYSIWSAMKCVLILSLLLWWLPLFGQMITGYVGGRKAGGPWRGIIAAIIPVIAIFAIITAFDVGLLPQEIYGVNISPSNFLASVAATIPFLEPYITFTREYVAQFVATLEGSSPYQMNSYIITLAFAYIGGIIADQKKREIDYTSRKTPAQVPVPFTGNVGQYPVAAVGMPEAAVIPQSDIAFIPPSQYQYIVPKPQQKRGFMPWFHLHRSRHGRRIKNERFEQLVPENLEFDQVIGNNEVIEIEPKRFKVRGIKEETVPVNKSKKKRHSKEEKRKRLIARRNRDNKKSARKKKHKKDKKIPAPVVFRYRETKRKRPAQLVFDSQHPKSIRKVHRIIEDEWNPALKKKHVKKKSDFSDVKRYARITKEKGNEEEVKKSGHTSRKSFARSWDTM